MLEELEECLASSYSVEDTYIAGEVAGMINAFLEKMKAETRIIFVRRYYYADSVKVPAPCSLHSKRKGRSVTPAIGANIILFS